MIYGLDLLGLAKYPMMVRHVPQDFALGVFAEAFGDVFKTISRPVCMGHIAALRVHLCWDDLHRYGDKDIPLIVRLARRYQGLTRFGVQIELSPFCEHKLSNPDKYLEIVANEAPDCIPVNTPMAGGALSKIFKNEVHSSWKVLSGCYNFSWDGVACEDADIAKSRELHKNCEVYYLWSPRFNGRWETKDDTPRPERKGWPDKKFIESIIALSRRKGRTKLAKKWLWKSHSENKGNGDFRAEKPVLISPIKEHHATLFVGKKEIATLPYYGPYINGRHRYYAKSWGYEILKKAKGNLVDVTIGKVWGGTINPSFRENEYRNK